MSPAAVAAPIYNNYSPDLQKVVDDYLKAHLSEEGQVLIFNQLVQPVKQEALNDGDVPVPFVSKPRSLRLKRLETIIDPGTGRPITIANLKGWAPNGQTGREEPVIEEIKFEGSGNNQIYVTADDPVLAARLLLDPKNKDNINPRRSAEAPDGGYRYEMSKPAESAEAEYDREMKIASALAVVQGLEDDHDQLVSIIEKLSLPTVSMGRKLTDKELLMALTKVAKAEPARVENLVSAGENKLEQLIGKAEKLNLIDFVEDVQQWRWKTTQEPICEAVAGYKPQYALILFIQNNAKGTGFSQMLAARVKQEEKGAKKPAANA